MIKRERWFERFVLSLVILGLAAGPVTAGADNESELRHAQIQLRQSEEDRADLRARVEQLEQRLAEREAELASYVARERKVIQRIAAVDAAAQARRAAAGAGAQRMRNAEVLALREEQVRYAQAVKNLSQLLARQKEELALNDELIGLCRDRNREMYDIAGEIVAFKDQGTTCRSGKCEPFLQLQRVKMENALQDFETRLRQQRVYEDTLPPSLERLMMEELEQQRRQRTDQEQEGASSE